MTDRRLVITVAVLSLLLLAVGVAGAIPRQQPLLPSAVSATVASGVSYQGRLTTPSGSALNGSYSMRFVIYDEPVAGSSLWDSGNLEVTVADGLFNVQLGVDQADFNGQALWLSLQVEGQTLSPRQEILPAPYALSLRPGADIVGEGISAADAALAGYAPATGMAFYADASGGAAIFGESEDSYGVRGASNRSWGGYFSSSGGYGIRVETAGSEHYDHGAYISSVGGYGVYAQSEENQAVRGEAGDVSGISQPAGAVGVVGMGASRGTYGASENGVGLYGTSENNYAGYFYSGSYRGVYSSSEAGYYAGYFTNRGGSTNPGVFVNGSIVASGSKSGYVVDISRNGGTEPLEAGDVVAVVGVDDPVIGQIPVMRVVRATAENAGAVVGVVDQRFVVEEENGERLARPEATEPRLATNSGIEPEEYLSVVTLGAFRLIKVDASYGAIQPGDLLAPSPNPGYAMRVTDAAPGTVIGKALEPLASGSGAIAVYVSLQ